MEAGGHRGTQLENRERGGKTVSVGYMHLISKLKRLTGLLNAQPRGRKELFPFPYTIGGVTPSTYFFVKTTPPVRLKINWVK